ncbi:MAG: response regulator [Verrucomicrobiota bacterium]
MNVLIIEDSEPDQFLFKKTIEKLYPKVVLTQAFDGKQALEMISQMEEPPDLIFLDINMPVMNGHQFLEAYAQEVSQQTVVIMLTSSEQQSDIEKTTRYEFVKNYCIKPLSRKKLMEILEDFEVS